MEINRRNFLSALAAVGTGAVLSDEARSDEAEESTGASGSGQTFPMLQNPSGDEVDVVWGVGGPSTGWVEWGPTPQLGNRASEEAEGMMLFRSGFLHARIQTLTPGASYYYRTVTQRIELDENGRPKSADDPVFSEVCQFTTPSPQAPSASFSVVNDTHNKPQNAENVSKLVTRLYEVGSDFSIWNGDILDYYDSPAQVADSIFRAAPVPFGATKPALFINGNHDCRGAWVGSKTEAFPPREQVNPKYRSLIRNFAIRNGNLAMIGLDTGEDKADAAPDFAGLVRAEPYRVLQTEWLEETLRSPEIQSAPFVVVFFHIPLLHSDPNENDGGQIDGWARWQRQCFDLWNPLFNRYGVQLAIAAHRHGLRVDEPNATRHWTELIGGGYRPDNMTLIVGRAEKDRLRVTVENPLEKTILKTLEFAPRKI